jgi:hypothetical protein
VRGTFTRRRRPRRITFTLNLLTPMNTKFLRSLLAAGCALSFLLVAGCGSEVEAPPADATETVIEEPEAAEPLGRTADPVADDSTQGAAEDGPGAGGGYDE